MYLSFIASPRLLGLVESTHLKPLIVYIHIHQKMSTLSSAHRSRVNGSNNGFGTLSGSIPKDDFRSDAEINQTHFTLKLMHKAQRVGDWELYSKLQSQLQFS